MSTLVDPHQWPGQTPAAGPDPSRATGGGPAPVRGRGWSVWWVIGGVCSTMVIMCGAVCVASALAQRSDRQHQVYQHRVAKVFLDVSAGDVVVRAGDGGTVTVDRHRTWAWHRPTSKEIWDGDTLRISPDCGRLIIGDDCLIDYTIAVPADTTIEARVATGDVTVRGLGAGLRASTNSGDITLADVRGDVVTQTGTGNIRATGLHSSRSEARTSSGDVTLWYAAPPASVDAATSTGSITIAVPPGEPYRVRAAADVGTVRIDVAHDPTATRHVVNATAVSGDVAIRYP